MTDGKSIEIVGARTNNLKNISVNIPKNKLTVVTGISGSGKSSLAFGTVFAEAQRRFIVALTFNSRQHFEQMPKPAIESIKGLSPAISLSQHNTNRNPRSTVATITDIHSYLRILFARIGKQSDASATELEPKHFSFNSPHGACEHCRGKGTVLEVDVNSLIDTRRSLNDGAILPWNEENSQYYIKLMQKVAKDFQINMEQPINKLDEGVIDTLLYGIEDKKFKISYKNYRGKYRTRTVAFEGVINDVTTMFTSTPSEARKEKLNKYMLEKHCPVCEGFKLMKKSLEVSIANLHIGQINNKSIAAAYEFFDNQLIDQLDDIDKQVATLLVDEIKKRLFFMKQVGLDYLTLDRPITTLSGGEIQRLRLTNQISSEMSGVIYVLDEPSIGLHQRDTERLINMIKKLVAMDNTVIVVEHDEEIINASDYLIDIGPGAGSYGGEILAVGSPLAVSKQANSITGQYLSANKGITIPEKRRKAVDFIQLSNCQRNNLTGFDVDFPLGVLTLVTGVSGSGKSTLVNDVLYEEMSAQQRHTNKVNILKGREKVDKVIRVTQSPIGRTPRSTPATYTGVFDDIRSLYAKISKQEKSEFTKSDFSFNLDGGRCEECKGDGYLTFDMGFVSDLYIECPTCNGTRYKKELCQVLYEGKSIADVLDMYAIDALELFMTEKKISRKLQAFVDVGLGYIKLGQPSTTLSGGEAQRVKLASFLHQGNSGKDLFIFDEPTTGLHMHDVKQLLAIFDNLVERGNTIIVIEHNLDVIKCADHIIDLGPEGGIHGGNIVATGTPEQLINVKESLTGKYLKEKNSIEM